MLGTPANRRLRSLAALLTGGGGGPRSAATAAEQQPLELTGVRTQWQPGGDKQGFGPRAPGQPPRFGSTELAGALQFFRENGFCVIAEVAGCPDAALSALDQPPPLCIPYGGGGGGAAECVRVTCDQSPWHRPGTLRGGAGIPERLL